MLRNLASIFVLSGSLLAEQPTAEQLSRIFAPYQHTDTPGCAAGVEMPGREPWIAAYGMADLEHATPNRAETVFEAGSVSKQFTAAAVLLLVERKQVSLDDDIRKYFPELPAYEKPVTVRHLLNHTSGLRDWGEVEFIAGWPRTTREYTHAHVLEILSRQRSLNYLPGEAWSYTNSGYNLAAMLVERVTGSTLQAFCRKEFFAPLGMKSTQWRDDFHRIVADRAIAYQKHGSEWRQNMPFEDVYGNGGLLTTVSDLLKWNRNLASGSIHRSVFDAMEKPGSLNDGRSIRYGFGLFLEQFEGMPEVSHSGATAGYRAWLGRIPAKGISIAVICNASTANATAMAHDLAYAYLGLHHTAPAPAEVKPGLYRSVRDHSTIEVGTAANGTTMRFQGDRMFIPNPVYKEDVWERVEPWTPASLDEFTGSYTSTEAETVLQVTIEKGSLVIHRRPDASFPLQPTYTDAFKFPLGGVRFVRNAEGKIIQLSLGTGRVWDMRFARN